MSVPDIDIFNDLLGSLTLDRSTDSGQAFDRLEAIPRSAIGEGMSYVIERPVYMWYRRDTQLKIESLLEKLSSELETRDHLSSPEISRALLCVYCLLRREDLSPVARLNWMIDHIAQGDCCQYLILRFAPPVSSRSLKIGKFRVGRLELEHLRCQSRKVKSDFFERNPNAWTDNLAISRSEVPVRLVDLPALWNSHVVPSHNETGIVRAYIDFVSQRLRISFNDDFKRSQEVLVACGAPYLDVDDPLFWDEATFVCVYRNLGSKKKGFFSYLGSVAGKCLGKPDVIYPQIEARLRDEFGFTGITQAELHQTLTTFCRFLMRAKIHEDNGRFDEAFFHLVIALDLLFGEKDRSTQSVVGRTSVVVCRKLGRPYEYIRKEVDDIYDMRSRYVHDGDHIARDELKTAWGIVDEVRDCLLRLQAEPANLRGKFLKKWHKELDYFVAAAEVGRNVPVDQLAAAGILDHA